MFVRMTAVSYMLHLHISGQNSSSAECKELWEIVHFNLKECVPNAINNAYAEQSWQPWYPFYIVIVVKKVLVFYFSSLKKEREKWAQKMGPFTVPFHCSLMYFFQQYKYCTLYSCLLVHCCITDLFFFSFIYILNIYFLLKKIF